MLPSTIASTLTNEQLAHEIILNPKFKLERHHQSSIERQVTDIATKAYFDKLAEDIDNDITKYNEIVPQLFYEIRERLNDLVAPSVKTELQEGIDIQLIKQQLEQKVFDLDKMIEFILDLIQRSCASIRDPSVQKIRSLSSEQQERVAIKQIQLIFDLLQEMALDLANHQLCSLRPHLLPIAIEYGRSKFNQTIQEQGISNELPKTKQWLQKTIQQSQEKASQRNPENIILPPTPPSSFQHQEIYEEAIVSLIMSSELIHSNMCPETLRLDIGRLHEYQNEAQAITIVAALLMLTRNFGATQHDDNDDLVKRLFILLEQQGTTVDHLATEIQRHCYTKSDTTNNEQGTRSDSNEMIYAMVDKTLSHTDAIYSLLSRRVSKVIKTYINNNNKHQDQQQEDKKIPDTILQSNGLYHVRKPLRDLCVRIAALTDYNYRVHNQWYKEQLELLL
ncbi:T-complex 11 [Circinella umbellata]|nr:T-complex 11 [Circinella umbellata]